MHWEMAFNCAILALLGFAVLMIPLCIFLEFFRRVTGVPLLHYLNPPSPPRRHSVGELGIIAGVQGSWHMDGLGPRYPGTDLWFHDGGTGDRPSDEMLAAVERLLRELPQLVNAAVEFTTPRAGSVDPLIDVHDMVLSNVQSLRPDGSFLMAFHLPTRNLFDAVWITFTTWRPTEMGIGKNAGTFRPPERPAT